MRYGSGLLDIPVSSVRPHLQVTGTFSAFWTQLGRGVLIDESGQPSGYGPGRDDLMSDGSVAVGLFDRGEVGFSVQSLNGADDGGNIWGVFGRLRLWGPVDQGVGLAVGGRYLTSPSYADGVSLAPGRLGFPDDRLRESYTDVPGMSSNLTLYAVATAYLRGYDGGPLPENDLTLSLGYGGGMFREGGELDFYSEGRGGGWFAGTSLHLDLGERTQLALMAEHNLVEYYLVDGPPGLLMLKSNGEIWRLGILSAADLEAQSRLAAEFGAPADLQNRLRAGACVAFLTGLSPEDYFDDEEFPWEEFIQDASRLSDDWVVAIWKDAPADIDFDPATASYDAYLSTL